MRSSFLRLREFLLSLEFFTLFPLSLKVNDLLEGEFFIESAEIFLLLGLLLLFLELAFKFLLLASLFLLFEDGCTL